MNSLTAELVAPRQFRLAVRPAPRPMPGEVVVRVAACGICGSDLHNYLEGGIGDTPAVFPMVLGHEPCGTVVESGDGVSGWSAGDRVAIEPAVYCYHCEYCLTGRHNVCANLRFLSQPGDPGFFREFAAVPAASLMPLPPTLGLAEGTLFEPLAVAIHSIEFAALRPGESAAVFGAGPVGLLTVAMLRLGGAGRIWSIEPVVERRQLALEVGADAALDPNADDPAALILGETGGRGADVVLDCATCGGSIGRAIQSVRRTGRIVITGIPSEVHTPVAFHALRRKEVAVFNVRRSNHNNGLALRLLAGEPKRFLPILTHRRPLRSIQEAFEMLAHYSGGAAKVVLEP